MRAISNGVEIFTSQRVIKISRNSDKYSLTTHNGREFKATYVLVNCAPQTLALLLGSAPPESLDGSQVKINMLLTRLPRLKSGIDSRKAFAGTFHIDERQSDLERAYEQSSKGFIPDVIPAEMYCHTLTDNSILSPELDGIPRHLSLWGWCYQGRRGQRNPRSQCGRGNLGTHRIEKSPELAWHQYCMVRKLPITIFSAILLLPQMPISHAIETSMGTKMVLLKTISGAISPKSVHASNNGLISAHNMMYRRTVTIYDANALELKATVRDSVSLSDFGYTQQRGIYQGAPVEGAFSPVGSVPKVVQVTPDNKYILVSNWCSYTVTAISTATGKTVRSIKIGPYPRGIAVSSDSRFAFVAEMGGSHIHRIDLANFKKSLIPIGSNPRAIQLSPDGTRLYATLNASGRVVAWDLNQERIFKSVVTGKAAHSLTISSDGTELFVVNFKSGTVSKLRTDQMKVTQIIKVFAVNPSA